VATMASERLRNSARRRCVFRKSADIRIATSILEIG